MRHVFCTLSAFAILLFLSITAGYAAQFGPYDYYDPPPGGLSVVERVHLAARTKEFARKGDWCAYWADLDYTLRAFPNHPRALQAMTEFLETGRACSEMHGRRSANPVDLAQEMEKRAWEERTTDYYFKEGIKFRPQYAETRMLYGNYLRSKNRYQDALEQYTAAEKLKPGSSELYHQLGLLYLDMKDTKKAAAAAQKAYKLGNPPPDLKDKLIQAGAWNEPVTHTR
jgi:tetratricopeptide (TPR) repeat protein